jgi:hypothetical protein
MEKKSAAAKKTSAKKAKAPKKKTVRAAETVKAKPKSAKAVKASKPCTVEGCKREYRAKGYCKAHYRAWRHGKLAKPRYTRCHTYACTLPMATNRHGFCEKHFQDYYVKGMEQAHAPAAPAKPEKVAEKAAEKAA